MKKLIRLLTCSIFLLGLISSASAQGPCSASYTFSTSGTTVQFTNTSTVISPNTSYYWNFGDNNTSSAQNPSHTYNTSGYFYVCLTIIDSLQNCWDTYCDTITVGTPSCYAYFSYQASNVNNPVYFYNSSMGASTYHWDFGDASTSSQANPNHTYANPGTYNVCLTITNSTASCIDTFCTSVTVAAPSTCNASFTFTSSSTNTTAQFTNTSTGGSYYYWDFGDNTTSGAANPSHTYNAPGTYWVCLTVYDSMQTCSDTYCDTVIVGAASCNAYFTYQGGNVSNPVYFYNSSMGGNSYFWDFGDASTSTQTNPNHTYANPGTYNVCLTITNSTTSCIDTFCTSVTVYQQGPCNASFTAAPAPNTMTTMQFTNTSGPGFNYYWTFGDNGYSYLENPSHTYNSSGIYMVCLTIYDSLQSCQDTYCDSVYVGPMGVSEAVQVSALQAYPNPFGDAVSISFQLQQAGDAEITVFDMLGNRIDVIESGKRAAGRNEVQWNASHLSAGVYLLKVTTPQGSAVKLLTKN